MREDDEALVPERTTIPALHPSWRSPWTIAAIVSTLVFVAQIFTGQPNHQPVDLVMYWATHVAFYETYLGFRAATDTLQVGIAIAIWAAFIRRSRSDRLLWSAAMTMTALVIVLSIPEQWHVHRFSAIAMLGFGSWAVVAWNGALPRLWQTVLTAACLLVVMYAIAVPFIVQLPPIYTVGTVAVASAIWCWSIALTRRFDIDVLGNS